MEKLRRLKGLLNRKVILRAYAPVIIMVIGLVVGLVGILLLQSDLIFGIGLGAVAALALLGIFKMEIK